MQSSIAPKTSTISDIPVQLTNDGKNNQEMVIVELLAKSPLPPGDFVIDPISWLKTYGHRKSPFSPFENEKKLVAVYRYGSERDQVFHLSEQSNLATKFTNRPSIHANLKSDGTGPFAAYIVRVSVFLAPVINIQGVIGGTAFVHAHIDHSNIGETQAIEQLVINPVTFLNKVNESSADFYVFDPGGAFSDKRYSNVELKMPTLSDLIVNVRYREKSSDYNAIFNRFLYRSRINLDNTKIDDELIAGFLEYFASEAGYIPDISREDLLLAVRVPASPSCVTIQGDIIWVMDHWELNHSKVWAEDWVG